MVRSLGPPPPPSLPFSSFPELTFPLSHSGLSHLVQPNRDERIPLGHSPHLGDPILPRSHDSRRATSLRRGHRGRMLQSWSRGNQEAHRGVRGGRIDQGVDLDVCGRTSDTAFAEKVRRAPREERRGDLKQAQASSPPPLISLCVHAANMSSGREAVPDFDPFQPLARTIQVATLGLLSTSPTTTRSEDDRLLHPEQASILPASCSAVRVQSSGAEPFTYSPTPHLNPHDRHPGFLGRLESLFHRHPHPAAPARPVVLMSVGKHHHHHPKSHHHHDEEEDHHKSAHHHHHHHHHDKEEGDGDDEGKSDTGEGDGDEDEEPPKPERHHHHHHKRSLSASVLKERQAKLEKRGRDQQRRLEEEWVEKGRLKQIRKAEAAETDEESKDSEDEGAHTDTDSEGDAPKSETKKGRSKSKSKERKSEDGDSADDSDDDKK